MSRYKLPEPLCRHVPKGFVSAGDPTGEGAFVSTVVCDREACIADATEWAEATTKLTPAPFRPFKKAGEK
ncbi:MAG: hypothetical protein EOO70_08600 [Myxococcaceae bacterium]|nr:MAG: hypothetical protein EOO70_08600 [Myxococcaceae bacterium]